MSGNSLATMQRFGTWNAVLPKEGPKAFPFTLDFRTTNRADIDLTIAVEQGWTSYISGFFIDNSLNAAAITVTCEGTLQGIKIPAGKQAYMPMLITDSPKLTITTTQANDLLVPFQAVNFPLMPCVW